MGPKGCPPYGGRAPITDYKHMYLANLFMLGTNPNTKYDLPLVRVHGSTKLLVKTLQLFPSETNITQFTISKDGGYWYVSVLVKSPNPPTEADTTAKRSWHRGH